MIMIMIIISAMGLQINPSKCEIISRGVATQIAQFNNFIFLAPDEAELLGAPLFPGRKMDAALAKRCTEFNTAISRLSLLSAHDALILFRASFSAPKMMHMLRCSPCTEHPLLEEIDNILRKRVCAIANLALTDLQWLQASLLVKEGGLGVRCVTSLVKYEKSINIHNE